MTGIRNEIDFCAGDRDAVIAGIMSKVNPHTVGGKIRHRCDLQDYETNQEHCYPQRIWDMCHGEDTSNEALGAMAAHLSLLGLRNPSEPTSKKLASLFLIAIRGRDAIMTMPHPTATVLRRIHPLSCPPPSPCHCGLALCYHASCFYHSSIDSYCAGCPRRQPSGKACYFTFPSLRWNPLTPHHFPLRPQQPYHCPCCLPY